MPQDVRDEVLSGASELLFSASRQIAIAGYRQVKLAEVLEAWPSLARR